MPVYEFRCRECGAVSEITAPIRSGPPSTPPTCVCGTSMHRVFGFSVPEPFEPHFNVSAGGWVSNKAQLKSLLSKRSDEISQRMGIDHRFSIIDTAERGVTEALGVTEHGLKEQHDRRAKLGLKPLKGKL